MKIERNSDKFMMRLPYGLRDRIKLKAAINRRSMNSEIVIQLEKAFPALETATGASPASTTPVTTEL